ncbi:hemolysin family protein [Oribacterium sp. HCP28S3_H8]|jgi:putative hemolysin|uniref:hemolysin family protein n=1 Tax=Oribacterium sp. HCP28S3_H8 TaxID=3438945 RepID=UPI003F88E0EC
MLDSVILLIILIIIKAIFTSAETASLEVGEARLRKLKEEGSHSAERLLRLTEDSGKYYTKVQVLTTLAGLLASAFAVSAFLAPMTAILLLLPLSIPVTVIRAIAVLLITLISGFFIILLGEMLPRRLAHKDLEKTALGMALPLTIATTLISPAAALLRLCTNCILRIIGISPEDMEERVSEEDILMMIDEGTEKGTIESSENEMIQNVFEFNDLTVEDVCTHRTEVAMLYLEDSDRQWRKTIHENRYSNYPICGEDDDDIIGILDTKDYFRLYDQSRDNVLKNAVDKPYFVSQNMKVSSLFQEMKKDRKYYAVVLDEYGGMTGIVTLHDLVEALVGDIEEEDEPIGPEDIETVGPDEWIILGEADLEDVNEKLGLELPTEDADTFGGYIMGIIGKVPDDGSSFHVDTPELEIDVASIKNHRIGKTVVRKKSAAKQETGEPQPVS